MESGRRRTTEPGAAWPAATVVTMPGTAHSLSDRGGDVAARAPTRLPDVVA
jgi:hypothetical protein